MSAVRDSIAKNRRAYLAYFAGGSGEPKAPEAAPSTRAEAPADYRQTASAPPAPGKAPAGPGVFALESTSVQSEEEDLVDRLLWRMERDARSYSQDTGEG